MFFYHVPRALLEPVETHQLSLMSRLVTKPTKLHVRPAKTQISLGIRPVLSESSLCAQWVAKDPWFLHADGEDSDLTGRMPRLIWVFAGHTVILLVLSRGGSYLKRAFGSIFSTLIFSPRSDPFTDPALFEQITGSMARTMFQASLYFAPT